MLVVKSEKNKKPAPQWMPANCSDLGLELVPKEHEDADGDECDDDGDDGSESLEQKRQAPDSELEDGGCDDGRDDWRFGRLHELEEHEATSENHEKQKNGSGHVSPHLIG